MRAVVLVLACSLVGCSTSAEPAAEGGDAGESADVQCEGRGDAFVAGLQKTTDDGSLRVSLLSADPSPPGNAENFWSIELTTMSGDLVDAASIVAVPHMVDHGHGAAPQQAVASDRGRYELGPLSLTMPGLWEVTLEIRVDGRETSAVYEFCISAS